MITYAALVTFFRNQTARLIWLALQTDDWSSQISSRVDQL